MSLVYLVTRLPRLHLGQPAPLTRAELVAEARSCLEQEPLREFERVALLGEVEETVRVLHRAQIVRPAMAPAQVAAFVRTERRRTALGLSARDLPEWVLDPVPQQVLMRRYWQRLVLNCRSERLRAFAQSEVNLEEALTALRCQRDELSRAAFLAQMSGHFDSSSRVIVACHGQAGCGIGQRFAWWPRLVAALAAEDRIEGQRAVDKLRFEAIDALDGAETFCVEAALATYYRLHIIERESSWDREAGLSVLDQVLAIAPLQEALGAAQ